MLRALFEGTDPGSNLNPGKIVAADSMVAEALHAGAGDRSDG
jgi:hypothetical protein